VKQKAKKETEIKKVIGNLDSDTENEETEVEKVYVKKKKAPKKKVIYLEESSSEEEVQPKQKITTKQNLKSINNEMRGPAYKINFI